MSSDDFNDQLKSLVDSTVEEDVSLHQIEELLQKEAQNVRENRRVYEVFVFECPESNCKENHTELIATGDRKH
jgi:hypothetical protein